MLLLWPSNRVDQERVQWDRDTGEFQEKDQSLVWVGPV